MELGIIKMSTDQLIRDLRYKFFRLSAVERFYLLVSHHCITAEMIDMLPIEFYQGGFEFIVFGGKIDEVNHYFEATKPKEKP